MAVFYNQATLSFNDNTINSNIVTGEIVEVLDADKTSTPSTYSDGDEITYIISIVNSGTTAFTGLTITDNLGEYPFGAGTLVPLTYTEGSVRYFVNGVLQSAPAVADEQPLTITGINVPAGGNAVVVYRAEANQCAPIDVEGTITNTAVISGGGITAPITVSTTVSAESGLNLSITKAVSPETVSENGQLTYTFTIQNLGSVPAVASDNLVVTDTFDPVLDIVSVTLDGTALSEPADYSYDEVTGVFTTTAGRITVPAATYSQDPGTGAWIVTPGVAVLRVTGNI
ncbi:MAG: DUF11 domain-containing protein [Oscillospiraceae bacterium]|nr:DUF11 domain-containing protein [Oscillospiraceae bacterium]